MARKTKPNATKAGKKETGSMPGLEHSEGPYPEFQHPKPEACWEVVHTLADLHDWTLSSLKNEDQCDIHNQRSVLDSLVRTILSQNTTDVLSGKAFNDLKERYATWREVLDAPDEDVIQVIKRGGLARTKTTRIKSILHTILEEAGDIDGEPSLEHLRDLSNSQIKETLRRFKGVGPKTISCVLMFCLGRKEFPVDTHVFRITRAMGWVPPNATRETTYEHLNTRVPDPIKYDLHCLLVNHGKACKRCSSNGTASRKLKGKCTLPLKTRPSPSKKKQGKTKSKAKKRTPPVYDADADADAAADAAADADADADGDYIDRASASGRKRRLKLESISEISVKGEVKVEVLVKEEALLLDGGAGGDYVDGRGRRRSKRLRSQ